MLQYSSLQSYLLYKEATLKIDGLTTVTKVGMAYLKGQLPLVRHDFLLGIFCDTTVNQTQAGLKSWSSDKNWGHSFHILLNFYFSFHKLTNKQGNSPQ